MYKRIRDIFNNQFFALSLYARTIAGTLILFVIARYLTVYDYGLFTSYKSIASFCLMFANMEFQNYILVSSQANVKEIKLKISLFLLNAVYIVLFAIFFSLFFKMDNHILFALIVIRTFLDNTFFALIFPYFQATRKFNTIGVINIIYAVCIVLIAIISYVFKLSLIKFLLLNIGLGLINFIQCTYYAKINYLMLFGHIKRFLQKLDKTIFGYIASTITDYLYAQTSSLYVATYIVKNDAALYFAAITICMVTTLITSAQTQKMTPELIKSDYYKSVEILKSNIKFIMAVLLSILVFIIFMGKHLLLALYGQEYYQNAYGILVITFLAGIFIANGAIFGSYLTAINQQLIKVRMKIETTIVTFLGLIILHKFGIYGAASALLISSIYVSTRYTICSLKFLKKQKENVNE